MNHHLIQIGVLLMTYVAINDASKCDPNTLTPANVSPQYVLGTWRAVYCIESQICSAHIRCNEYHYNVTDGDIVLYVHGYNTITNRVQQSSGVVIFTGRTGEYVVENLGDIRLALFVIVHAEKDFGVYFGCLTDYKGITRREVFISTKNNPENRMSEEQLARAKAVVVQNQITRGAWVTPSYNNCYQ